MLVLALGSSGLLSGADGPLVGEAVEDTGGEGRVPKDLRDIPFLASEHFLIFQL